MKNTNIHGSLQGARLVGLTHTASIFASGTLLFVVQERALRRLEPDSGGDFSSASPLASGLAGCCGGAAYGLQARFREGSGEAQRGFRRGEDGGELAVWRLDLA